jgi:hypothetical protein
MSLARFVVDSDRGIQIIEDKRDRTRDRRSSRVPNDDHLEVLPRQWIQNCRCAKDFNRTRYINGSDRSEKIYQSRA